mmetsp:Transcript_159659/g.294447  ORF Transcript_159659/g.294447 Transcript_159659/m.294447 type:complete len:101 (-) Transcript_159659:199-501(-)
MSVLDVTTKTGFGPSVPGGIEDERSTADASRFGPASGICGVARAKPGEAAAVPDALRKRPPVGEWTSAALTGELRLGLAGHAEDIQAQGEFLFLGLVFTA